MSASPAPLALVTLPLPGLRVALEVQRVRGLDLQPAAGAPPLETTLGLGPVASGPRGVLILAPGDTRHSVPAPLAIVHVAASRLRAPPPLLAARCRIPGLKGLVMDEGGLIVLIDPPQAALDGAVPIQGDCRE